MSAITQPHQTQFGHFDFDLTAAQEERARRLHDQSIIVDLMFQGPLSYRSLPDELLRAQREKWERTGDVTCFVESLLRISDLAGSGALPDYEVVWRESGLTASNLQVLGNPRAGGHLSRIREMQAYAGYGQALTAADIRAAKREGRHVSFLNFQFFPEFMSDISWIEDSYAVGVRMAGLTYNKPNQFGSGCTSANEGLTPLGREAIVKMNELGMLVDTAHAGERTTIEACRLSKVPVIASHAPARALFEHARGKSDDALRALKDCGGVCGVVTAPVLLTATMPGCIELVLDQIDYLADKFGIEFVAIGTDWPLQLPKWVLAQNGPMKKWVSEMGFSDEQVERPDVNLLGFDDYRDFPNLTRGMVKRGYSDDDIRKVLGDNALRVFDAVWR